MANINGGGGGALVQLCCICSGLGSLPSLPSGGHELHWLRGRADHCEQALEMDTTEELIL